MDLSVSEVLKVRNVLSVVVLALLPTSAWLTGPVPLLLVPVNYSKEKRINEREKKVSLICE